MRRMRTINLERKKQLYGMLFVLPWCLGLILLMAIPLFQSLWFSFNKLTITEDGFRIDFTGVANFRYIFLEDAWYVRNLTNVVLNTVLDVPLIIFFSLFTAMLLTQKFRGRMFARAIIFLPVVLTSGVIAKLDNSGIVAQMMGVASQGMDSNFAGMKSVELTPLLLQAGVSPLIVDYLTGAVNRIYQIISLSGVQILIFLAGLQSISASLYEAAKMEGATGYESFWKITFPMISPLLLTNTIYTIIDSFYDSSVTSMIQQAAFTSFNFGVSAAMAWIYFLVISLLLIISTYLISKRVYYQ
ncbi:carbohydrate ABC transporter permease [Paenibacillus sp. GXUN7292]|uniref:carbohydrate ABC transporter permease n=1 Tax=Paenibacillus sp. GXUN7292 TaxID=3422499 RepID=UPI003D7DA06C